MKLEQLFQVKGSKLDNEFLIVLKCLVVHINTYASKYMSV